MAKQFKSISNKWLVKENDRELGPTLPTFKGRRVLKTLQNHPAHTAKNFGQRGSGQENTRKKRISKPGYTYGSFSSVPSYEKPCKEISKKKAFKISLKSL